MREVYLYQTVHVLDGECLCLREHLAVLDRWSRTLFGCPGPQDAREVGTAVAAVVGREAPGSDRSKFVRSSCRHRAPCGWNSKAFRSTAATTCAA
ncbi:MAG: hypothetical protein ACLSAM_08050 [Alistipes onderdonkii]